jgi:hypothetical protein
MLINYESCLGAFLLITLYISFYACTCWVPTISLLNLAISLCYTNLLLKKWRWTEILQREVLGYALPRLLFLWCYGFFRCSVSLESRLVFEDIICVINILYSWHLAICEHFLSVCGINDPGHTCDEYLVLLAKSGMTEVVTELCEP